MTDINVIWQKIDLPIPACLSETTTCSKCHAPCWRSVRTAPRTKLMLNVCTRCLPAIVGDEPVTFKRLP